MSTPAHGSPLRPCWFQVCAASADLNLSLQPDEPAPQAAKALPDTPMSKFIASLHYALDKGLGSFLLMAATALSLYLANNAALSSAYLALWDHHIALPFIPGLNLSLRHWINEVRHPSYMLCGAEHTSE